MLQGLFYGIKRKVGNTYCVFQNSTCYTCFYSSTWCILFDIHIQAPATHYKVLGFIGGTIQGLCITCFVSPRCTVTVFCLHPKQAGRTSFRLSSCCFCFCKPPSGTAIGSVVKNHVTYMVASKFHDGHKNSGGQTLKLLFLICFGCI